MNTNLYIEMREEWYNIDDDFMKVELSKYETI